MSVVGTRPNFMKSAPVVRELRRHPGDFEHVLFHSDGQRILQMALDHPL